VTRAPAGRILAVVELFGISPQELIVVAVVAVIVFGQRLPQVAGEAAATVQKLKRALNDLRRDSGIDNEIRNARREIEQGVVRPLREVDLEGTVRREIRSARTEVESATNAPAQSNPAPSNPPPSASDAGDARPPDPEAPPGSRPG
jgi:TatA/E family protein of Tat protein translocase